MGAEKKDHAPRDTLLSRISTEMVRTQKQYFGKGPTQAKSYFFDDMLLVVMKGGVTTAEHTMLDFGQEDKVRDFRQVFENEMTARLSNLIEDLTGRKVVTYQSQIMFAPDRVIAIFVFDDVAPPELRAATAEEQLRQGATAEAGAEDIGRDEPSSGGRGTP